MSTSYRTACCGHIFVGLNHSPLVNNADNSFTCRACNSNIPENMVPYHTSNIQPGLTGAPMRIEVPQYHVEIPREWRNVEAPTTTRTPIDNRTPQQIRDEYSRSMNQHVGRGRRVGRSTPALQFLRRHQEAQIQAVERLVNPPVTIEAGRITSIDYGQMESRISYQQNWQELAQYMQRPEPRRTLDETDFEVFGAPIFVASDDRDRTFRLGDIFDLEHIYRRLRDMEVRGDRRRLVVSPAQYDQLMQVRFGHEVTRRRDRPERNTEEIYGRGVLDSTIQYVQQMAASSANGFDQTVIDGLMPSIRGALEESMGWSTTPKDKADKPDTSYVSPWLP